MNILTVEKGLYFAKLLKSTARRVVFPLSKDDRFLISEMKKKLYDLGGVGLAAPQVGESKRIIAIYITDKAAAIRNEVNSYPMHVMINPSFKPLCQKDVLHDFEGCYSVASKAGKLARYRRISVAFDNEQGESQQIEAENFYARVIQHEIDHLNGTLITDHLTADSIQGTPEEMLELRRSELSDEKRKEFDKILSR